MKTLLRLAAVATALAFALPALACDEHKTTTASESTKSTAKAKVAKTEKKADKSEKKTN